MKLKEHGLKENISQEWKNPDAVCTRYRIKTNKTKIVLSY
jgi:hypothetical protein